MKFYFKIVAFYFMTVFVTSCKNSTSSDKKIDTILTGQITLLSDESIAPVIQQEIDVFQNIYDAKITLRSQSEIETVLSLVNKTSQVAVLTRKLNSEEEAIFKNKKINPEQTKIATDAIVLIKNNTSNDSLLDPKVLIDFLNGKTTTIKGLVFDNLNSSNVRYLLAMANSKEIPKNGVFSFKNSNEVINYVANNEGYIGVVGMNWLFQPNDNMKENVNKLLILRVKNAQNEYVYPSQETLVDKSYPLARDLYIINCQGYSGLGIGFSAFVSGDKGQRIMLNAGLAPNKLPGRKIKINTKFESK